MNIIFYAMLWRCLLLFALFFSSTAQSNDVNRDARIQTALTLRILKFVTWPSSAAITRTGTLHLCTVGRSPVVSALNVQVGMLYNNRPIVVHSLSQDATIVSFRDCDALYVSIPNELDQAYFLTRLAELPIVTIAEGDGFIAIGGMFQFRRFENKYIFDVSLSKARAVEIKIGAPLLSLASEVR